MSKWVPTETVQEAIDVDDPATLSPRQLRALALDTWSEDRTDETLKGYYYQTKAFVEWCEDEAIGEISDVTGWHVEQFRRHRKAELKPVSLKGQMDALRQLMMYAARIEAVDDALVDASESPKLSDEEKTSDKKLNTEDAKQLLEFYRDSTKYQGTVEHVVLEILWHTGCRVSGLRALDLKDYDADEQFLYFKNRPATGTRLKRGKDGQRSVLISDPVCEALETYIARERFDKRDEHGRKPLISCRQGRPAKGTLRAYCYMATQPCVYQRCPHGEDRRICEYLKRNHSSKCPSSRAPHHVRTGSITWHRDRGVPLEDCAERVNASQDTIKEYYDKADSVQRMDLRRRQYTEDLDVSE